MMKKLKALLAYLVTAGMMMSFFTACTPPPPAASTPIDSKTSSGEAAKSSDAGTPATVGDIPVGYYEYENFAKEHSALTFSDAPSLKDNGLPPIAERLPKNPISISACY